MLRVAIVLFGIAVIAAVLGFSEIAAGPAEIAKIVFVCCFILAVLSLVGGLTFARRGW